MNRLPFRLLALLLFVTGLGTGVLAPGPAEATSFSYSVWSQPGTSGSSATLTCGWHDNCTYGSDGVALDWMNSEDAAVYWRSWSSNSQGINSVGRVYVANQNSGSCYTTYGELKTLLGTSLNGIVYRHTSASIPGSPPYVSSGLYPATTSFVLGYTVDNDCAGAYPAHLHQERGSSSWTKNTYYPTRAGCNDDSGCQTDAVWGEHHSQRLWYAGGY